MTRTTVSKNLPIPPHNAHARCFLFRLLSVLGIYVLLALTQSVSLPAEPLDGNSARMWEQLLADAARLRLPTQFLKDIPSDFIRFEFEDLRTYAAEYHPDEHRLVLNRTLSFNAAGGTLRPLAKLTHKELEVLYHELFHAYMDFLATRGDGSDPAASPETLLSFARKQQACRYGEVTITPVVQRRDETESRYLTEGESWEALNETWAVFIGWAVWNQLEVQRKSGSAMFQHAGETDQWLSRLERAIEKGDLRGYYVPEDPDERRLTLKRFLARQSQISGVETEVLMRQVLGLSEKVIEKVKKSPKLFSYFNPSSSCDSPRPR